MSVLTISFDGLHADNSALANDWELMLRLVGDFEISISGERLYKEQEFCVVEFGVQAVSWVRNPLRQSEFLYRTVEAEETGLVFIKQRETGWQVGSIHQLFAAPVMKLQVIADAVEGYWMRLLQQTKQQFQCDICPLLSLPARAVGAIKHRPERDR